MFILHKPLQFLKPIKTGPLWLVAGFAGIKCHRRAADAPQEKRLTRDIKHVLTSGRYQAATV